MLRVLRKSRHMTLVQCAAKSGIPVPTLQAWESGRSVPPVDRMAALLLTAFQASDEEISEVIRHYGEREKRAA